MGASIVTSKWTIISNRMELLERPQRPILPSKMGKRNATTVLSSSMRAQCYLPKILPKFLWTEAVNTAVYILNRTLSMELNKDLTPYEQWTNKKPNLNHVKVFDSDFPFMNISKQFTTKFDARAKKVILVGYQGDSPNYRLYDPKTKKRSVSRNVIFHENLVLDTFLSEIAEPKITLPKTEMEQLVEQPRNIR